MPVPKNSSDKPIPPKPFRRTFPATVNGRYYETEEEYYESKNKF